MQLCPANTHLKTILNSMEYGHIQGLVVLSNVEKVKVVGGFSEISTF